MKQRRPVPSQQPEPVIAEASTPELALEAGGTAAAPPPDAAPVASILALAARSFGAPLDVQVRVASPVAVQAGSAGVTVGDEIHIHPMATGPDGSVSAALLAHELVHVQQQAQPGQATTATPALEGQAHAHVDAILTGAPVGEVDAAAPGAPQHLTLVEYFDAAYPIAGNEAVLVEDAPATPDADLLVGSEGSYAAVVQTETGLALPDATLPDVGVVSDTTGSSSFEGGEATTETRTTDTELVAGDEGVEEIETVQYERTTVDLSEGKYTSTTGSETTRFVELDEEAKKSVAFKALKDRLDDLDGRMAGDEKRREELEKLIDDATIDGELSAEETEALVAGYREELDRVVARKTESASVRGKLTQDIDGLVAGTTDLVTIEGDYAIDYTDASRETDTESSSWSVGLDGVTLARETAEADGSEQSEEIQIGTGGVQVKRSDKTEDGTETSTEGGLDLSEGVGADGSKTVENADKSSTTVKGSVDLVYDEEKGLQGIEAEGGLALKDKDGTTASVDVRATLTKDEVGLGVDVGGKAEQGDKKNGSSFGVEVGADGSIAATVEPQDDGRFKLSVTLKGKLGIGANAEKHAETDAGQAKGGGDVSASGSEELSFVRILDHAAAEAYFGQLERGGDGEYPEFGWVGKLLAGADGYASALDDPGVAAGMQVGESYSFKTTLAAKLCLSSGWGWVGGKVGVNGEGSWAQSVSMQADGAHWSQDLSTKLGISADGTLTSGLGVSAEAGYTDTTTVGVGASGVCDLSTDKGRADYAKVMGATSVDALLAAARSVGAAIGERNGESTATKVSVGLGGVAVVGEETRETHEEVTEDEDGLTADVGGASGESVQVDVGDQTTVQVGEKDSAEVRVDEEGLHGEFTQEETTSTTGDGDVTGGEVAAGGLPKALRDAIFGEETRLKGYEVDPADMTVVITQRAPDRPNWERCCVSVAAFEPWRALRTRLISPVPAEEYADTWPKEAAWLDQARAIATFMADSDADGFECWQNVLRHFGDDVESGASTDLGERSEWPPDMGDTKKAYDTAFADADRLPALYASELAYKEANPVDPFDYDAVDLPTEDVIDALDEVAVQILMSESFESTTARSEMADRVNDKIAAVRRAWAECHDAAASFGDDDALECRDTEDLSDTSQIEANIANKLSVLARNKAAERALTREAGREQGFFESSSAYELAADAAVKEVKDLWDLWVEQIRDVRELYRQLDLPEGQWKVGPGLPVEPRYDHEPDPDAFVDAYLAAHTDPHVDTAAWNALRTSLGSY